MTEFFPPYYGSYADTFESRAGGGTKKALLFSNANYFTGEIITSNYNKIDQPGDSATLWTSAWGVIQFNFQMPSAGRLNVVATVECRGSIIGGHLDDDTGWSNATVTQNSWLTLWLPTQPDIDHINHSMYVYYHRGDNDGAWGWVNASLGELRQYSFISQGTFAAGDWVPLSITLSEENRVWVNDYDSLAELDDTWIIRKLDVTSV